MNVPLIPAGMTELFSLGHYLSLGVAKTSLLPQMVHYFHVLRLVGISGRGENEARDYQSRMASFRYYYLLSTLSSLGITIAQMRSYFSPSVGHTLRQVVGVPQTLMGAGIVIHYIKEVEDKRVEKGMLTATVMLLALETVLGSSSRCTLLRSALGVGTSAYGGYFYAKECYKSLGRKKEESF